MVDPDRKVVEVADASLSGGIVGPGGVELEAGPERGFASHLIEVDRLGPTGEVVVAQQRE